MQYSTIKQYKKSKLVKELGERTLNWIENRVLRILTESEIPVSSREDFYVGVLKTRWEFRDIYETSTFRLGKEKRGMGYPRFVKVSYNHFLSDKFSVPLHKFDLNGVVVDLVKNRIVYPGMSNSRQVSDMDAIQGIIDDPYLRCSAIVNPPLQSPLLTLFCIPETAEVFVQYGSSPIVKSVSQAMFMDSLFEHIISPLVSVCSELEEDFDKNGSGTNHEEVGLLLYNTLFGMTKRMVLSIRFIQETESVKLFVERTMITDGFGWVCMDPSSLEGNWLDMCLGSLYWTPPSDFFLREGLGEYIDGLVREWRGYGDVSGRFVPIRYLRIIPEEVGVRGGWETFHVVFEPTYDFQNYVYENLAESLFTIKDEHGKQFEANLGDVLDDVCFLGTPPAREFSRQLDEAVERILTNEQGVWYHWKDVAFPIGQFWAGREDDYEQRMKEYADATRRSPGGILRTHSGEYLCRRLLSYYLCTPPEFRMSFVESVGEFFALRARIANLLHNQDLPCSPELKKIRRKFESCRSLGARKFSIGRHVSDLSWEDVYKIKV